MTDRLTIRIVVLGLLAVALGVIAGLVYALAVVDLTAEQRSTILGVLASIGTAALGAVAGILAHTASQPPSVEAQATPVPPAPIPVDQPVAPAA